MEKSTFSYYIILKHLEFITAKNQLAEIQQTVNNLNLIKIEKFCCAK